MKTITKTNWRQDKITDKQFDACVNMKSALGWKCEIPVTKGEACDLIDQMKKEIQKRLAITGRIGYSRVFDDTPSPWGLEGDEDSDDDWGLGDEVF